MKSKRKVRKNIPQGSDKDREKFLSQPDINLGKSIRDLTERIHTLELKAKTPYELSARVAKVEEAVRVIDSRFSVSAKIDNYDGMKAERDFLKAERDFLKARITNGNKEVMFSGYVLGNTDISRRKFKFVCWLLRVLKTDVVEVCVDGVATKQDRRIVN